MLLVGIYTSVHYEQGSINQESAEIYKINNSIEKQKQYLSELGCSEELLIRLESLLTHKQNRMDKIRNIHGGEFVGVDEEMRTIRGEYCERN